MTIGFNTNTIATKASLNLSQANDALRRSLARLSSGNRIVDSTDDPGGVSLAYKLNSRLIRTAAVKQNVQNSISFLQVQDGALQSAGNIVSRMSELRSMAQDITKNSTDVEYYSKEFLELQRQLSQIYRQKFNGVELFAVSDSDQNLSPDSPILNKASSTDENGGSATNFSRRVLTHDGGQAADGNVSMGVINFEDVFRLGALDTRYVEKFTGRFTNLSNADGLNVTNYSTAGAGTASTGSSSSSTDTSGQATGSTAATPGAASAYGWAIALNDGDPATYPGEANGYFGIGHQTADGAGSYDIFLTQEGVIGNNYSLEIVDNMGGQDGVVQLDKDEAISYTNDGSYDFRLNLANPADQYSLNDLKSLLEASGTFYVSLGSVTDPANFRIFDSFGWSNNTTGNVTHNAGVNGSDIGSHNANYVLGGDNMGTFSGGGLPGESGYMSFDFSGGTDNPPSTEGADGTDTGTGDGTDTGTDGTAGYSTTTPQSAAEENSTPDQNAEVFTDDGFLSSILFVSIGQFSSVIELIADARAENGAEQNRLLMVDELLTSNMADLEAAHGQIMDTDIALESSRLARHNVMVQAAASMVAQANQLTNVALTLLGR
jgi:flagellin-like hook-associated protein FlgL